MDETTVLGAQLVVNATAAAGLAKTAVDVVRTQQTLPSWASPVAAFFFSLVILAALFETNGIHIDSRQVSASLFLGAVIATPMAIGASAVQSAVERKTTEAKVSETVDAARFDREKLVADVVPTIAQAVGEAIANGMAHAQGSLLQEAAQQGARAVIAEARANPAA